MRGFWKVIAAVLTWSAVAPAVQAGGWFVGINLGLPLYPRPWYGYGCYYRPYPVYVAPPPVVIEAAPVYRPVAVAAPTYAVPAPAPAVVPSAAPVVDARARDVQQYLAQLNTPDQATRASAVLQLGRMKAQQAIDPLMGVLNNDRSPSVREAAARSLGLIGAPGSLATLQRAAQADDDHDVRHSAQFAAEIIRTNMQR